MGQGLSGPQGPQGAQGPQGPQGEANFEGEYCSFQIKANSIQSTINVPVHGTHTVTFGAGIADGLIKSTPSSSRVSCCHFAQTDRGPATTDTGSQGVITNMNFIDNGDHAGTVVILGAGPKGHCSVSSTQMFVPHT